MDALQLRETLSQIHHELEQTDAVDERSRELLGQVLRDIERLLSGDSSQHPPQGVRGVLGSLRSSVEHFEDTHPFLASLIGRIADGLSSMGI